MSHITELMKPETFLAGSAPLGRVKALKNRPFLGLAGLVLLGGLGLAAWHASASTPPADAAQPPVPVTVAAVHPQSVRIWSQFSGRMTAVDSADVRPEVNGRITEIRFKDGQQVQAGDVLFVIDPRPYEAAVAKAQADLATANSNATFARTDLARAKALVGMQAIARTYYDQRVNSAGVAEAAIQSAQAQLAQAKIDLDHAYVKAPISGRVGRAELTVGNLVQTGATPPLLTSVVSGDGIYADFDVDEQTYLQTIRDHATTAAQEQKIPVELSVQGDESHIYKGTIESFDNKIDTGTGTIRARARFANTDGALVPGMFVSVKLASAANSKVILVPEDAVGNDQSKRFVFVVGKDHKAMFREIALGQSVNGERVVTSGLRKGEEIVVDGLQKVQPGAVVEPHLANAETHRSLASR
ncbi:MAG TPA: efflux RND transporter periplasmic adaptor subunit [Rhizomicrobium sp.]|jgi:multidrug efflux system membrane fusion protein